MLVGTDLCIALTFSGVSIQVWSLQLTANAPFLQFKSPHNIYPKTKKDCEGRQLNTRGNGSATVDIIATTHVSRAWA